jgi:hypothetical protein
MLKNRRAFFYATPRETPTHAGHTAHAARINHTLPHRHARTNQRMSKPKPKPHDTRMNETKHTASPRVHARDLRHPTVADDKRAYTSVDLHRFRPRTTETDAVRIDPSDALFRMQTFRRSCTSTFASRFFFTSD